MLVGRGAGVLAGCGFGATTFGAVGRASARGFVLDFRAGGGASGVGVDDSAPIAGVACAGSVAALAGASAIRGAASLRGPLGGSSGVGT